MAIDVGSWLAIYDEPLTQARYIDKAELKDDIEAEREGLLIFDVRNADFCDGNIKDALNITAQSIYGYSGIGKLVSLATRLNASKVVIYCNSSRDRAIRTAGWFQDFIQEHNLINLEVVILTGGIRGWIAGGEKYTNLMEGFNY
ncbi:hypothetical protein NADFUDRAFT_69465 [Nadsonia fulvescens var. elongata DSM 6958]|uniref:Rhodanese domain-containing protein n=1 Tax=Nadsonia fulvescens var. elongata DSM 6958 TaxID=857566 RepID=A0A1E3PN09_9ASCO|nr:hypothetical protein NADFUDRAFT_69465 [Nadsonia fulvescens var. elongata DSM 6958]